MVEVKYVVGLPITGAFSAALITGLIILPAALAASTACGATFVITLPIPLVIAEYPPYISGSVPNSDINPSRGTPSIPTFAYNSFIVVFSSPERPDINASFFSDKEG